MAGPSVKVQADLSSFDASLNDLRSTIKQMGDELRSASGKADLNFSGPEKQLKAIVAVTDKLTTAFDKLDRSSASHAKNAKATAAAMAEAAKLSSRIETQGGSSNRNVSNYFRNYSNELNQESNDSSSANAIQRDREQTQARIERERQANQNRWANRAASFASFAGGAMLGGGTAYSTAGSGIGGLVGRMFGLPGRVIGSALGGITGGIASSTLPGNKEEALRFSELSRSMGGVSVDFESLRSSVRNTVTGLGVTNLEAAVLAKNFAKTANLSSDVNNDIAKNVGVGAGFAKSYGISSEQGVGFMGNMRGLGIGKGAEDSKRLALQIGESVGRANMSGKMGDVLQSINGYVSNQAEKTLSTPNYAEFTSLLTTMIGSSYSGLRGNAGNASNIIANADAGVRSYGNKGEASQFQWLSAHTSAFSAMNGLDNAEMQEMGLLGDLTSPYSSGSLAYDGSSQSEKARRDKVKESIQSSGYRNNLQVVLAHAKKISGENEQAENRNIQGMLGLNSVSEAAAIKKFGNDYQGQGDLEKKLGKSLSGMDASKISKYATVIEGNEDQRKDYYKNIRNGLSKEDMAIGDKALAIGGSELKDALIKFVDKSANDPGLEAQLTSVQLQNKMADSMTGLIDIENTAKNALIELLRAFTINNPLVRREDAKKELEQNIGIISQGKSKEEREALADSLKKKMWNDRDIGDYPVDMNDQIKKAVDGVPIENIRESGAVSLPATTPGAKGSVKSGNGYAQRLSSAIMARNPDMSGRDIAAIVGNASHETAGFTKFDMGNRVGAWHFMGPRKKAFLDSLNGRDPSDVDANADFLTDEFKSSRYTKHRDRMLKANSVSEKALIFEHGYEVSGAGYADRVRRSNDVYSDNMDQLPESHKKTGENSTAFRHTIDVNLFGQDKKPISNPFTVSSVFGRPQAAGV